MKAFRVAGQLSKQAAHLGQVARSTQPPAFWQPHSQASCGSCLRLALYSTKKEAKSGDTEEKAVAKSAFSKWLRLPRALVAQSSNTVQDANGASSGAQQHLRGNGAATGANDGALQYATTPEQVVTSVGAQVGTPPSSEPSTGIKLRYADVVKHAEASRRFLMEKVLVPGGQLLYRASTATAFFLRDRLLGISDHVDEKGQHSVAAALAMQAESAWQRYSWMIAAVVFTIGTTVLWEVLITAESWWYKDFSEESQLRTLATAMLAILGAMWMVGRRYRLDPAVVRVAALAHLNSSTEALLMLHAPIVGRAHYAAVKAGGGLRVKGSRPQVRPERLFMALPVAGSGRQGVALIQAVQLEGQVHLQHVILELEHPWLAPSLDSLTPDKEDSLVRHHIVKGETQLDPLGVFPSLTNTAKQLGNGTPVFDTEDDEREAQHQAAAVARKIVLAEHRGHAGPNTMIGGGGTFMYERILAFGKRMGTVIIGVWDGARKSIVELSKSGGKNKEREWAGKTADSSGVGKQQA